MLRKLRPHRNDVMDHRENMVGDVGHIMAVSFVLFLKWSATEDVKEVLEIRDE